MHAIQTTHHGGPEALRWQHDVPGAEPGAGEVRVGVIAAGLNNIDLRSRDGAYGSAPDPDAGTMDVAAIYRLAELGAAQAAFEPKDFVGSIVVQP